ncbi:remodeling and spacing factor 1 [Trichonephila inaurata madagascariensis]|uniref:Remodeling and spacing factor 1 n=1 Tax=Trichonephila inaurata madagascariensis TaxID=2747483 RepID=A0A8X6IBZ9_9ARAC|nr:remodeling and spacing factor 1 [Trichonephila inaurata madagascariensis]
MYEDESKDSEFSTSRETEKSKKRRRGKGARKGYKPWDVSSESSSSIEELTEEEEEEEHEEPLVFEVNEDEFACEEVEEDAEPIVVRRARTAKKAPEDTTAEENVVIDDKPCSKCGKYDKPEWILLCDKCDNGYHTQCLIPPLVIIPEGDWYCQPCEHAFLCEVLQKELHRLELILKQREREELRKQRLAYVGISLDNVLKPEKGKKSILTTKKNKKQMKGGKGRKAKESSDDERNKKLYGKRSVRARRNVNYQFKEYDALIASAIQEEMLGVTEDEDDIKNKVKEEENDKSFKAKIPRRGGRKRSSRLNDLDFSDEDLDSGEEYKGSSSESEQTAPPSSHGSDGESAASGEWRIVRTKGKPKRKPRRKRRGSSDLRSARRNFPRKIVKPPTKRKNQRESRFPEWGLSSSEEELNDEFQRGY